MAVSLAIASAAAEPAAAQSAAEQRQIDWALERGRLLFALDRAAWVGTDDMREHVPEADQRALTGYIVDRDSGQFLTIFYAKEKDKLVTAYRGRVGLQGVASREVFPPGNRPKLTARQQRLARALEQFFAASPSVTTCSRSRPNIAVVPPDEADGPIDLYVMTPQTEENLLPLGGHSRATLDRTGRIIAQRKFTNSCIELSTAEDAGSGQRPHSLMVTHLLDPVPTEIHVFTAMAAGMPLFVGTEDNRLWEVTGQRISFVQRIDD
jgi:hypothetical protein